MDHRGADALDQLGLVGDSDDVDGRTVVFDPVVGEDHAWRERQPRIVDPVRERIGRRLSLHLCPAPDLVLLLDAPGEVMYQRKREYDPHTLEGWRSQFLSLASRLRLQGGYASIDEASVTS